MIRAGSKWLVLVAAGLPAAWLWYAGWTDQLGAHPAEALIRGLGEWTLRLLCLTLAVTPVRQWTGWGRVVSLRRGLGLWTFAYALQHFGVYLWLDMDWNLLETGKDVLERPFILVGFLALLIMLPLAATSFNRAMRTLGAVRWKRLHRGVYLVAVLALLHFYWMRAGKNDFDEVFIYTGVLLLLGLSRVVYRWRAQLIERVRSRRN